MQLKLWKTACAISLQVYFILSVASTVRQLPHCIEDSNQGLVLVSTLDGKLSALNTSGSLSWQIPTEPGSLLKSNVHNLQLSNNGEWIQIIPSLSGNLYKFNGKTIDAIPIDADNLLKSSFVYSDDIVIAGGKEVKTYGVGLHTGHILYMCSLEGCQNKTQYDGEIDDVVIIERNTLTVRAHEPRTGSERWNFSVGHHNIKIPHRECANLINSHIDFNITTIPPEGLVKALKFDGETFLWEYKFDSPIVNVWLWDGKNLQSVDTFNSASFVQKDVTLKPLLYLAMHNKQVYIHESQRMLMEKQRRNQYSENEVIESKGVITIPWKPVLASSSALVQNTNDLEKSTAVSVLYASEYINGNGFYLYSDPNTLNEENSSIEDDLTDAGPLDNNLFLLWPLQWHWTIHLTIIIAICVAYFLCNFEIKSGPGDSNDNITKPVEIAQETVDTPHFTSHYESSFETIGCLGKGGFGVVFEAKQKIDQCGYAIKRICLHSEESTELVLREVRALASLDHKNIVRYFNSWFERPPPGFTYKHDAGILDESSYIDPTPVKTHKRTNSTIIDMSQLCETESSGGIVFLNETKTENSTTDKNSVSLPEPSVTFSKKPPPTPTVVTSDIPSQSTKETYLEPTPIYLYIQMQLCQAESLKEWLLENSVERDKTFALSIFKQIVDAVAYVHSKNLIHRDLKPGNIFFSLEGDIKIGDFGLVTTMNDNCDASTSFHHTSLRSHTRGVGTKLYMSPEQIEKRKYNFKVDIYSLGVILFELLVSFSTDSERIKTLTDLRQNKYPPDFSNTHKDEFNLLQCMLSKDPKKRPTTAEIKASLFL